MLELFGFKNLFYSAEWQQDVAEQRPYTIVSKFEKKVTQELLDKCSFVNPYCYQTHEKQLYVRVGKTGYWLDFIDLGLNLVIEINGDYWHMNPSIYNESDLNVKTNKTANEVWEQERERKREICNTLGCTIITIWEKDWRENKNKIINYINYVIESKKNNQSKGNAIS